MREFRILLSDDEDIIIVNEVVYRKEPAMSEEMWGRYELAEYLGFTTMMHGKTRVSTANLYGSRCCWRQYFPDFGKALDEGTKKPYPKSHMIEWLSMPKEERKRRLKANEPMGNY